ncbi:hypothetical protein EUGRSUZ_D01937 [Eucalyptus grandis]|uniref:MINDY deubiquitinase domain-containing protein n=3 Tax=Eucalyptus grandis TaxID=71139 RepID=A0A059CHB5_EUCGR|nr:hypothetical protein EUGRSUZ_D01937 [Eucalyptus grandis]KAK3434464.1 hypothetical protein EUGRSUZ_D01937 [Eucalyptus grandis]
MLQNEGAGSDEYHGQEIEDPFGPLLCLATGLHVNIMFGSIKDFVNTPELGIFHLLDIPLYHGCVVDPQDATAIGAIGSKSYDDLSSAVVAPDLTPRKRKLFQKIVENKSGLTPYGLSCLRRDVRDGELCVLFHNEHFSTMFKYKGQLYLLATDEAFLDMPNHVWEKLEKVKGGNVYVSSDFKECKMDHVGSMNDATLAVSTNDDIDEQLARSLQEEEFNA